MIALPVADRELRVASRKPITFRVRLLAAMVALVIGSGFLALASQGNFGLGPASLGTGLFAILTWLCLGVALSAGLFLTSDCLSEEKREGTLGLLFLTDLRGHDVVIGKLLASSLRGFYALLALFPILGIPLLMGGVSGPQFWKTCLALVNALVVSLTSGLFVSSISRDSQKALAGTVCLVLMVVGAGPAIDTIIAETTNAPFQAVASRSSAVYCFIAASAWTQSPFWWSLVVNQVIALILFGMSCAFVPRTWQERNKAADSGEGWRYRWRFGSRKARLAVRRKLLYENPVLWLTSR